MGVSGYVLNAFVIQIVPEFWEALSWEVTAQDHLSLYGNRELSCAKILRLTLLKTFVQRQSVKALNEV